MSPSERLAFSYDTLGSMPLVLFQNVRPEANTAESNIEIDVLFISASTPFNASELD